MIKISCKTLYLREEVRCCLDIACLTEHLNDVFDTIQDYNYGLYLDVTETGWLVYLDSSKNRLMVCSGDIFDRDVWCYFGSCKRIFETVKQRYPEVGIEGSVIFQDGNLTMPIWYSSPPGIEKVVEKLAYITGLRGKTIVKPITERTWFSYIYEENYDYVYKVVVSSFEEALGIFEAMYIYYLDKSGQKQKITRVISKFFKRYNRRKNSNIRFPDTESKIIDCSHKMIKCFCKDRKFRSLRNQEKYGDLLTWIKEFSSCLDEIYEE